MTTYDDWYSDLGGAPAIATPPNSMPNFKQEKRAQESISAGVERKVLESIANRLPAWVNSDHLTIVGSVGMFLAGVAYAVSSSQPLALLAAIFFLAVNWFGDSLDGTLARVRNRQRPRYGFYVDHMLDSFGALFLMGGLALSGYINPWIAIGMLVCFLLLSIEVYLTTYTLGSFQLSYGKLGPTEIRLALIAGNLALFFRGPYAVGHRFLLFDIGGAIGIAGMLIILVVSTVKHIAQLYREEPRP
jgi:archaetidylinositol phosphate synthase